ncbi:thioredoxin family protein [Tengunoibacter tsumagoiensis]|uniref:Thioredoxin domain-containing protein n=1 Tax=Tengunoibacter tsumagoiensis TaxID=2014871 RepID=A0A402A228_9CHLR|nr:thioredoxin family protein [Tengunoibacter tsumagoiensis]GCE13200.1 hypothetical protein KTT_30590 [Tengunoibacter tsumagoiensis]
MAENYITVTSENFASDVLQAEHLVIVAFLMDQSNASKIQEPEIEAISKQYADRVTFARLNVAENEELTRQWNITGIPTLVFFRYGREIYRISGIVMRARLKRQIEGVLLVN